MALAELDVLNIPNRNGDLPLRNAWSPVPDHRTDLVLILDDADKNYGLPGL